MNRCKKWLLYTLSIFLIFAFAGCSEAKFLEPGEDDEIVCENYKNYINNMDSYRCYVMESKERLASKYSVDTEPLAIFSPMSHQTIAVGDFHSLAIVDGSLWAWGSNWHGQLGDETTDNRARPVQIGTYTNWASVAVGGGHTVALKNDGSLWAWGYNLQGQLGNGTTEGRIRPTQIGFDTDWVSVFAGDRYTMAIKTDGSLWAWGNNSHGQLGDGTTEDRLVPTQVGSNTDWTRVMPDAIHTLALTNDGNLWFWGSDLSISFDRGSPPRFTSSSSPAQVHNMPVQIGTYADWVRMIAERGWHSEFLIKDDGSLWAKGNNSEGQLGDGTIINRDTFVQIGKDTDWVIVVTGGSRTVAMKTDSSVWSWGWAGRRTHCGEIGPILSFSLIGDGGDDDRHNPVKIIDGLISIQN